VSLSSSGWAAMCRSAASGEMEMEPVLSIMETTAVDWSLTGAPIMDGVAGGAAQRVVDGGGGGGSLPLSHVSRNRHEMS